jgi:aarF domain-containing kinase
MRAAFTFGRLCLRQSAPRLNAPGTHLRSLRVDAFRHTGKRGGFFHAPPPPPRGFNVVWAAAVALSPAVFVQLSEEDNAGTEQTAEGRMLKASRDEIAKKLRDDDHGISRVRHGILLFLDVYIWEPLCTGMRFLHLFIIFVPVIVSAPALSIGSRNPARDNERSGALWWYWFLVKSMERAGPAFIKVRKSHSCRTKAYEF